MQPDVEGPDYLQVAEEVQWLATQLLRNAFDEVKAEPPAHRFSRRDAETEWTGKVREVMLNVSAASDAVTARVDQPALRSRLISLRAALQRLDSLKDRREAFFANLEVAVASSRRLLHGQEYPVDELADRQPDDRSANLAERSAETTNASAAEHAAEPETSSDHRARSATRTRTLGALVGAGIATGIVVAGGLGFLVGEASDNPDGGAAEPAETTQAVTVEEVGRYMGVLYEAHAAWQPTIESLSDTRAPIPDCGGQVRTLDSWAKQINAAATNDPALSGAGTLYLNQLRSIAVDCDGTGEDMARAYRMQDPIFRDAVIRATELGWTRNG